MEMRFFKRAPYFTKISVIVAVAVTLLSPSVSATTCLIPDQPIALNMPLPTNAPDQDLFSSAVLTKVNFHRCLEGLPQVENHNGLKNVAITHAKWMATASTLSHNSTVPGQSSVGKRVTSAIQNLRTGSENIGYVHRYRVDEGQAFYQRSGQCSFTSAKGDQIDAHTYASLADRIVELWLDSPGHRVNVLDRDVVFSATAIAFDSSAQHCGVFYMAQEFAG